MKIFQVLALNSPWLPGSEEAGSVLPVKSSALSVFRQVSQVPLHNTDQAINVRTDAAPLRLNKQPSDPPAKAEAMQWQGLLFFGCSLMTGPEQMPQHSGAGS